MTALSPDNTYRLELMSPARIGAVLHPAGSLPGYAELYNNINGRSVARGPEQNFLGNADIHWDMKTSGVITVGTTIFWHIAPLASDGHKLPIEDEMDPPPATTKVSQDNTGRAFLRLGDVVYIDPQGYLQENLTDFGYTPGRLIIAIPGPPAVMA